MKRITAAVFLAVAIAIAASAPGSAQSVKERVTFASLDASLSAPLTATYSRPAGNGPFPAMVLLHTCGGLAPYIEGWAAWFVSNGYAALVVDSFGPRGVRSVCGGGTPTMRTRALDAFGALAYLRSRPEIDGTRIGDIGWSHGAGAAYLSDSTAVTSAAKLARGFTVSIALYPPCERQTTVAAVAAPMLFLLGADDDWTPASSCKLDADRLAEASIPVAYQIYPGATHAFDNPGDRGIVHVGSHTYTLNYNAGAAREAHDRVLAFLTQYLK